MTRFAATWAAFVVAAACDPPNITMSLELPSGANPTWIEIGAFPNACPAPEELAGGLPPSGLAGRVAYPASSPVPFGLLDTGKYGFAAIARRDDCGVVATGCSNADVAKSRSIDIALDPNGGDPDASACTTGLVCQNARCVPPTNGDDPNAGAGCSMVLVGAGPLPESLDGGPFVTAPAIAPLASGGFLIVYAEYLDADGTERVTLQPIDSGGGALAPDQQVLDGHCPAQSSIDAAGLVMGTSSGLAVLSRPPCNGESGFELLPLDASGAVQKRNVFQNNAAPPVLLSTHALSSAATANRFLLAANVSNNATLLATDTTNVSAQTTTAFGTPQDTATRVVRGANAIAVEVDGPSVGDAGLSGTVARVYMTAATTDPASLGAPVDQVSASITALTVLGGRAFLVTNGSGKGEDVAVRGYDLGSATKPIVSSGFTSAKSTTLLALDAAAAQNRLFCALEEQDSVAIAVIDGASSSSPQILRRVDLAGDIRIPKSAHDGPIAIAATDSNVAITWVEHKGALPDGDPIGGYAVFACKP